MREKRTARRVLCAALVLALGTGLLTASAAIPDKVKLQSGVTVTKTAKAQVDVSNLAEGLLTVKYTGGKKVRIKCQITKTGTTTVYTYNLDNAGAAAILPITEGDGEYSVKIYENTTEDRYAQAFSTTVKLQLRDPFLPFLYSNQYVNFTADSKTADKAAELCKGVETDLAKVEKIYRYAVDNITYDYELAKTVPSDYLPDVDAVLAAGKGICFDYAAVMAAMLRSRGIPCKLVVGYAGKIYHAWINVYISGTGWVDSLIYFDGKAWSLMDPTFVSNGKNDPAVLKYVGDGKNYTQRYAY